MADVGIGKKLTIEEQSNEVKTQAESLLRDIINFSETLKQTDAQKKEANPKLDAITTISDNLTNAILTIDMAHKRFDEFVLRIR